MLYVSSACLKANKISDIVKRFAEAGIRNIELSGGTKYYPEVEKDLVELKERCDLSYVFHAYFPPPEVDFVINLASCNDEIYKRSIEHYDKAIEMMKRVGSQVLSIHAGFLVEIAVGEIGKKLKNRIIYDEAKAYDRFCQAYKNLEKKCMENGITLYLENNVLNGENYKEFSYHNYMMMTDYQSIMKMKEQIEFNLLLDLGHLHVSSKTLELNYSEECDAVRRWVRWIHLSENNGIFDEHKPLKEQSEILKEFYKLDNQGINITLETAGSMEDILKSINILNS